MKGAFVSIFMCVFWSSLGWANTVGLRSAEHDGFTRVAIDLADPSAARILKISAGFKVILPADTQEIGTEGFFERISNKRISGLDANKEKKEIVFLTSCTCAHRVFVAGTSTLVLDIFDDEGVEVEAIQDKAQASWLALPRSDKVQLQFPVSSDKEDRPEGQIDTVITPTERNISKAVQTKRLTSARDDVTASLDRRFSVTLEDDSKDQRTETGVTGTEQIKFHSLQKLQTQALSRIEQNAQSIMSDCDNLAELNPENWPQYEDASNFLASVRNRFAQNYDNSNQAAITSLAVSYMSLGMGAEATAILEAIPKPSIKDRQLLELSRFVEDPELPLASSVIATDQTCADMLIWRLLGPGVEMNSSFIGEDELQRVRAAFDRWPSALKGLFAPKLANVMLKLGSEDAAKYALRTSEELPSSRNGERELVKARILEKTASAKDAIEILKPIVDKDQETAPEAVISLARLVAEQGADMRDVDKNALAAYQNELKGTELEQELIRARIITALQEQDLELALGLIEEFSALVRRSKVNLVLDEAGMVIYSLSSDADFLKEAVSLPAKFYNQMAQDIQEQIKTRVIELGFQDLADQLGQYSARKRDETTQANIQSDTPTVYNLSEAEPTIGAETDQVSERVPQLDVNPAGAAPASSIRQADVNDATPLAGAISETRSILNSITELEKELTRLGL
ncbi:hypothetical protein [Planktotalea sp.]|uniref:hypothetical protein n=1 Tax=Planktotalea sp. TaxID=2029877 RepID=UPI003F6A9D59